jgi:glutathione S-transferase
MSKVDDSLQAMAHALGEQEWCFGNHISLADISTGCALGYLVFRFPELAWQQRFANLDRLYQKLMQRTSFQATLPPQ